MELWNGATLTKSIAVVTKYNHLLYKYFEHIIYVELHLCCLCVVKENGLLQDKVVMYIGHAQ